jgi:hypothetical protein
MHQSSPTPVREVWLTLEEADQREVIEQFRQTIKEIIDEHFRVSPSTTLGPTGHDLYPAVESSPRDHEQGEPTDAVRAA